MAKVLVIEDDLIFRELVCEMLQTAGYEAIEAEDGITGVAAVARQRPDLVITDIMMPEQEGIETIQQIQQIDERIPIIAISGMWGVDGFAPLDDAMLMGARAALEKPISMNTLLGEVRRLLAAAG